jgi:uncharacterized protein YlzI (FlbEa/FlbD family)
MTNLNEIVFRVICGEESSGTAFLISESLALTAFHVIEEHKDNEIIISNGRKEICKAKLSEIINKNYEHYKKIDIALLELNTAIPYEGKIDFVEYTTIPEGIKWRSRGFPASKIAGDNILENDGAFITQQLSVLRNDRIDIELQHSQKLIKYCGYSGAPLVIENSIVGILLSELIENGVSKELNAQSVKNFSELLNNQRVSIQKSISPRVRKDKLLLCKYSQDALKKIPCMIGGKLSIERKKIKRDVLIEQEENNLVLLIGESGAGKSVLAKSLCEEHYKGNALWLDHYIFESNDLNEVCKKLKISGLDSALITELTNDNYLVVFDGLERISTNSSFALVAQLLSVFFSGNSIPKVLLTCQQSHWNRVQSNIYKHFNKIFDVKLLTVGNFEQDELQQILKMYPQFSKLFATSKLLTMLERPKIIDFFTRNPELPNINEWSSEADLVEWYWQMEVSQQNNGAMRESFILNLACKLGDSSQSSIRTSSFSPSELTIMQDLEKDGICTRHGTKIKFSHDLLLDWFKQRVILDYLDEEPEYCFSKIDSPSWHRAITLFGLHLLDHSGSTLSWDELFKRAEADTKTSFTCDLLLDSIICSQQPDKYIESIWSVLVNDGAKYLKALVTRFLFIATTPDPLTLKLAKEFNVDLIQASIFNRKPVFPLWPSILEVIDSKKNELMKIIPDELGEICKTWLKHSPKSANYRKQLASIALEMGWKALQHKQHYRSDNRWLSYKGKKEGFFYEVAFSAINEELDELIKLTYCASGLSKPTDALPLDKPRVAKGTSEPVTILDELEPTYSFLGEKIVLPPITDGPQWSVQTDFQHFFLKELNSFAFMLAKPKVAAKLILALCIRESVEAYGSYDYEFEKYYDLDPNLRFFPPSFEKGTFLRLLQISPDDGLMVILRLTEVASNKWLDDAKIRKDKPSAFDNEIDAISLSFEVDGKVKAWGGDRRWMYTCRATTTTPKILICALMALEKWLSDKIDENKDITKEIIHLLDRSNSIAIIGVLLQLAKKLPALLKGVLFDLICVPELFYYDIKHVIDSESHQLMGYSFNHSAEETKRAKEWHLRGYRKKYLKDILINELLNDKEFQENIKVRTIPAFKRWIGANNDTNGTYSLVNNLIHLFHIDNWHYYKDEQGLSKAEFIPPAEITAKEHIESNDHELTLEMINIPCKCRQIIDGDEFPTAESMIYSLEKYSFMEIEDADETKNLSLAHTQCALAAVVVKNKNELPELWKQYESWCRDILLGTVFNPPTEIYRIPDSAYSYGWDRFCADTLPLLWSESPENKDIRAAVANLCIGLHLETVERLFIASANYRSELNGGFYQLLHLATIWSSYNHRISISTRKIWGNEELTTDELIEEFDLYYQQFVNSTLPSKVPSIRTLKFTFLNPLHCYEKYGRKEAKPRSININLEFLKRAYAWLPELADSSNLNEKSFVFEFWKQCVDIIKWQLFDDEKQYDSLEGMPYAFDKWLFSRLPKVILSCDTNADAKKLWQPILELGPVAHYWIKDFAYEWFSLLGMDSLDKVKFVSCWKEMLNLSLADTSWCKNKNYYTDCWSSLLGLDNLITNYIWVKDNSAALKGMEKYYEDYALNCHSSDRLNEIVKFLNSRSGEEFRLMGLTWIDTALNKSSFYFNDKQHEEHIAILVKTVLEASGNLNRLPEQYKCTLQRILKVLAERKNPLAMAIYDSDLV